MDKRELTTLLLRQLESKLASTFFINGPPGAGKTHLLNDLASNLPAYVPSMQVLGPYSVPKDNVNAQIIRDLLDLRYLESPIPADIESDWYSNWTWLQHNLKTAGRQSFLVLIRLDDDVFAEYEELRAWFSSIRYMEHYWTNNKIRVLVVVAGYWNHPGLEDYYHSVQLSFPYTTSTNYTVWNKISLEDATDLVSRKFSSSKLLPSFSSLIYEVTGGFAGAIIDLLNFVKTNKPTMIDILHATHKAAQEGQYSGLLVNSWRKFPPGYSGPIKKLLLFQRLNEEDKKILDLLALAGIIAYQDVLDQDFAKIRSWYIELLLKDNVDVLGINDDDWRKFQFDELAPSVTAFNVEAYSIINNIENLLRNFLLARLCEQNDGDDHVLSNRALRRKKSYFLNEDEDAYERAEDWRQRSQQNGINVSLNPLITYISTGDLAQLIKEEAVSGDPLWNDIVNAVEKITPIRDAVMHNQIIDEGSLDGLYVLQARIYRALNR